MINALSNLVMTGATDAAMEAKFIEHIAFHSLSFGTVEEYKYRLNVFAAKDAEYEAINNSEEHTFKVAHNKFSTLTHDEYKKMMGRKGQNVEAKGSRVEKQNGVEGVTVDWRTKGAVNPVQDQGQCGSCWAFSSTAAMEGAHFITTGTLLKLSESQFVDCDTQSSGCNGGLEMWAFDYAEQTALELEVDYPYVARTESCKATAAKEAKGVTVAAYQHVPKDSVSALKSAIDAGPTCVSVDAANNYFQGYTSGILNTTSCGTNLDHAITAVGYGTESGQGYFIVRNSWGSSWGESGYIRISSDVTGDGVCGILMDNTAVQTD